MHGRPPLNEPDEPRIDTHSIAGGGPASTLVRAAEEPDAPAADESPLGHRALRTRDAILSASRRLFLDRGYAGTRIGDITTACGISRAGFYTYFRDKREIFNVLGRAAYRDLLEVVERWNAVPRPCGRRDVEGWVREYFAFLDQHGAFILSAHSGPDDEGHRADSVRMQMRTAWLLGLYLRDRQRHATDAPEALGLTLQATLERSWYYSRAQGLPVADTDVVRTVTEMIMGVLAGGAGD